MNLDQYKIDEKTEKRIIDTLYTYMVKEIFKLIPGM